MQAVLLTIGTEITSGEIVNSNAAWVAMRLEEAGTRVLAHITVRDQRDEISQALRWANSLLSEFAGRKAGSLNDTAKLIIITGGLGPTSDDLTRECVAEHVGTQLQFDFSVWSDLQSALIKKGVAVRENHKHQCYFPASSHRLHNSVGTAHGFALHDNKSNTHYFALPGPPRELEPMWEREIGPSLNKIIPQQSERWYRWTCIGVPESEVAEAIEEIIAGTNLEVGYRAKPPHIYLKIFARPDRDADILKKIEARITPWQKAPAEMKFD